ncbi:plasmid stabilization system protein ParE [Flavobacterium sp. CG_23.5]|uniref:type II toxin-antitoxin system RelE/ParE family toxin n=1 Tax=unclassified Flavobacterium TaxID=196869 RepID=UPI0018CBD11C|nr:MULTISPECIES: type II toxin-antitoxin system RelE/ParE family toxin [unclassified Flavobacterium]MBG6111287.1 plasmid stabilization system protein ParE [Flavobacterium sp. CG_9.10]MBP2282075.1 plasmid stabilization system protein ParE [Flavobacterium sp. CG_23.5]
MKVFLSEQAQIKLLQLNDYLLDKWNVKVRDNFIFALSEKISQISTHPKSCIQSNVFNGIYKCVVTKQITFYYRILSDTNEIEIITLFDSRQNSKKLNKQLKRK